MRQAAELLDDPAVRLLTLTGPGWIGKTTLARTMLGRRLLVLDNLEQLMGGVGAVGDLLAAFPGLAVLATSRMRLGLTGERELAMPPLALPDAATRPVEEVATSLAVDLFVRWARRANPAFALTAGNAAAVAEVCRRLDGLPLALELGVARLRLLSPEGLLARLDAWLELLSGGPRAAPERHRTIRDTVAWSVDLLRPEERRVFGYLAVFVGGCAADDLAAAVEAVEAEVGAGSPDVPATVAAPSPRTRATTRWRDRTGTIESSAGWGRIS